MTEDQKEQLEALAASWVEAEVKRKEFIVKTEAHVMPFEMNVYQQLSHVAAEAEEAFCDFVEELCG